MKKTVKEDKTALNTIEEAFYLLRTLPVESFISYYIGTMPFLLGLLYFWNDMSKNAFAREYCLAASFGLVLLYIWMKTWQSVFSIKIYETISRIKIHSWSIGSISRMIIVQTIVHTSSIIILPIAFLITIPFAWTFAMYQMILVYDFSPRVGIKSLVKDNFQVARHYTLLNHLVIGILLIFGFVVFINIGIAIYWMPFLAKAILGIESAFTMGGFSIFNSTFILSVICLTHLCIDPLIKTVFTLEKFYYRSRETGDDLMADLTRFKTAAKIMTGLFVLIILIPLPTFCCADESKSLILQSQRSTINTGDLETAINQVISHREFTWRMPKEEIKRENRETGFFYQSLKWIFSGIKSIYETFSSWMSAFFHWVESIFPKNSAPFKPVEPKSRLSPKHLAAGLIILAVLLLFGVILHIRKLKQNKKPEPAPPHETIPDITDESLLADRLPSDKWVDLAFELMEKGDLRLAIRARYLGTLAFLADKNLVILARHKSNREYCLELSRKTHSKKEIVDDFDGTVNTIDRIWYGMHKIDRPIFDEFAKTQKRIIYLAG